MAFTLALASLIPSFTAISTFGLQLLILAFILVSAGLAVALPVIFATTDDMGDVIAFSIKGGSVWLGLLFLVTVLSLLVI